MRDILKRFLGGSVEALLVGIVHDEDRRRARARSTGQKGARQCAEGKAMIVASTLVALPLLGIAIRTLSIAADVHRNDA
jgi:hypothetical protein